MTSEEPPARGDVDKGVEVPASGEPLAIPFGFYGHAAMPCHGSHEGIIIDRRTAELDQSFSGLLPFQNVERENQIVVVQCPSRNDLGPKDDLLKTTIENG